MMMCDFVAKSVRIKYVDRTTNKPLFSQGSAYAVSDLKASRTSSSNYSPLISTDPNDPAIVILTPLLGNEVLTLANLPADKISIEMKARSKECCAALDITSLKVNNETVCAPCNDLNGLVVVIKK